MKYALLAALLLALPAQADLYRWVDPQTGSVKFSSLPPPWLGDPEKERHAPAVEVIPYRGPAGAKPAPEKPAAVSAAAAQLEARWAILMQQVSELPLTPGFDRTSGGLQQQVEAVNALKAELDRLDPAGAQRRAAQEARVRATLRRRVESD